MNILSLFDGLGCAMLALQRANIAINAYFASEIDKKCINVSKNSYSGILQIGNVNSISALHLPFIDLIIGGFPCQGFSNDGKKLNFNDPRSKLFFECVRLVRECKPKYFLFENVKMKKEWANKISNLLGVYPIEIDSSLVSAQNRKRLYWTNIPVLPIVDKIIFLPSILQKNVAEKYYLKHGQWKGTTLENYHNCDYIGVMFAGRRTEEAKRIRREFKAKYNRDFSPRNAKEYFPRSDKKSNCLTATFSTRENVLLDETMRFRVLTPIECERLQTLPDNYTQGYSDLQRRKMIGNGFTVDIISHILKGIKN